MLLPKKVGSFTLTRRLDGGLGSDAYVATLEEPAGKQVVARRVPVAISADLSQRAFIEARVRDLMTVRHPTLIPVLDVLAVDNELWVIEEWSDSVSLRTVVRRAKREGLTVPHNVFLNLATQVCNGLEALHGRRAATSGEEHILHLAIRPESIHIDRDGRVRLGRFGFTRSPLPNPGAPGSGVVDEARYLSPEQTQPDPRLSPASDIFSLGVVLYEALTREAMFGADDALQTVHQVRRAEVSTQLLEVKEALPGLDRVLFRALSLNPRHRYQRAFVLREDLRGLMAGFSFADIEEVSRAFFGPVFVDDESLSNDFGEDSAPTHVGPLPGDKPKRRDDLRPKTFLPEFDDEEVPPTPPPPPRRPPEPDLVETPRVAPRGASRPPTPPPAAPRPPGAPAATRTAPDRPASTRPAPQRRQPTTPSSAPAPNRAATPRAPAPPPASPVARAPAGRPEPARAALRPPAGAGRTPPVSAGRHIEQRAVDEDEEPTIGPSSLTLETVRDQLSFDDVVRRRSRPLDEDEQLLFENSDTNQGVDEGADGPTERGSVGLSQGGDGSLAVQPRTGPESLRGPGLRPPTMRAGNATLVPPDQTSWIGEADAPDGQDPDTWNPRADVEPDVNWAARPSWSELDDQAELEPATDPETLIAQRPQEFGRLDNPLSTGEFENFVDEDEVDTREHAAGLWERKSEEESADDPVTAWRPDLSPEEGIRVFDDPTFDAGVDVGFDEGLGGEENTADLLTGAAHLSSLDLFEETGAGQSPEPLPVLPPRDFAAKPDPERTVEAKNPLPDLPPRDHGRPPPAPSLPSFQQDGGPAAPQHPRGTLVPPPGIDEAPVGMTPPPGPRARAAVEATANLGRVGDPLQRLPPGLTSDDFMQGGVVSDDHRDEEARSGLSWRVVFAVVAGAGFLGAVTVLGVLVYLAQQPEVADFARGLLGADEIEDAPLGEVVDVADEPMEPEPVVEVVEEVEEEPDPLEELAAIQAEAEVRTEVDPSETFAAMRAMEPEPAPAPIPAPVPAPAPVPEPPAILPRTNDAAAAAEPAPEEKRRNRKRDRDPEPEPEPARVAFELPPPPVEPPPAEVPPGAKIAPAEMDRWSKAAFEGRLSPGSAERLADVEVDDPQFTRARTLLYLDAKKRGRIEERRGHLGLLMSKPENQYNPVLLVEHAQDAMELQQYGEALKRAREAEQYWARIPSKLVYSRQALIHEINALAHTGLFYDSEGRDLNFLTGAIRAWERYQEHANRKGRVEMAARAEVQLQRLRQLEERLK